MKIKSFFNNIFKKEANENSDILDLLTKDSIMPNKSQDKLNNKIYKTLLRLEKSKTLYKFFNSIDDKKFKEEIDNEFDFNKYNNDSNIKLANLLVEIEEKMSLAKYYSKRVHKKYFKFKLIENQKDQKIKKYIKDYEAYYFNKKNK